MRTALAPVEARAAERLGTPAAAQAGARVDAEGRKMMQSLGRNERRVIRDFDPASRRERVSEADTKPSCNMVVTGSREAQARIPWSCAGLRPSGIVRGRPPSIPSYLAEFHA
jgi:hypothetical protein